jgi:hypothetical protein
MQDFLEDEALYMGPYKIKGIEGNIVALKGNDQNI